MKENMPTILVILFLISFVFISCGEKDSTSIQDEKYSGVIDADDSNIQYVGRFDKTDPKRVVFDWPGVYIRAKFEGTSCTLRLKDGNNLYAITVDDQEPQVLKTDSSDTYPLAAGLKDTAHTILIQKRTESNIGKGEFSGFILDKGKSLLKIERAPDRRIEFIGNSITCGYGVEGKSAEEPFKPETENAALSYAALIGKSLNADYSLVAYSGKGVVRNYGEENKTSEETMPFLYERTCCNDSELVWDYTSWIPQVVVINLGTNDYSTKPLPDKLFFQKKYSDLIKRVQKQYPGVTVFCVCGPMIGEPCASIINEVVKDFQQKSDSKVHFINATDILELTDYGSDWHPNISGHQKTADLIIPVIKEKMNW